MLNLDKIKKTFTSNGFVKIEKLFTKKEVDEIINEIEKVKIKSFKIKNPNMHLTKDKKINTIHNINTYVKKGPIIKLSKSKKILSIVNKILDEKSNVRNIEFFFKPKKTGMKSPFHQDNYYWNIANKKALNVWIACSPSSNKNGGVCYIEGTHKNGLLKHTISYNAGSSQKIPEKTLHKIKLKKSYPNLLPGDCIFHHCEVVHGSSQNKSNKDRVGLVISYKGKSARLNLKSYKNYKKMLKKNISFLKLN